MCSLSSHGVGLCSGLKGKCCCNLRCLWNSVLCRLSHASTLDPLGIDPTNPRGTCLAPFSPPAPTTHCARSPLSPMPSPHPPPVLLDCLFKLIGNIRCFPRPCITTPSQFPHPVSPHPVHVQHRAPGSNQKTEGGSCQETGGGENR